MNFTSQYPAIDLLQSVGYTFVSSDELDKERKEKIKIDGVHGIFNNDA